jgi:hypothetical protein
MAEANAAERCERAAQQEATRYLSIIDATQYVTAAAKAPNSALLVVYQHGVDVLRRHSEGSSSVGGETGSVPLPPPLQPAKVSYLPIAAIGEMLGSDLPVFTYSKHCDVVVVVLLCGVTADGTASNDDVFHATFVYTPNSGQQGES